MNLAVLMKRMGRFKNVARLSYVASRSGRVALHEAMKNGDVEIVEILLSAGANLNVKDDLGNTPVYYAEAVPEIKGTIKKLARASQMRTSRRATKAHSRVRKSIRGASSTTRPVASRHMSNSTAFPSRLVSNATQSSLKKTQIALGKRISTATPLLSPMWVISLDTLEDLYGSNGKRQVVEVHQELKRRGLLMRWSDLPSDAEIIFVSHEWLSWAHPDPEGEQLFVLCRVMERLREGKIGSVEMDMVMKMYYKWNYRTTAEEWKEMLDRT